MRNCSVRACCLKVSLPLPTDNQQYLPPIPVDEPRGKRQFLTSRMLCGALMFPSIAVLTGQLLFPSVTSHLQRTLLVNVLWPLIGEWCALGWLRSRWYWLVYWCLLHRVAVLTCCSKVCWRCTSQSSCSSCTPAGASSTMVTFREQSATGMAAAIRGRDDGAELFLTKSWRSLNCLYQTVWTLILRLASHWSNDLQYDLKLNLLTPLWNPVSQN